MMGVVVAPLPFPSHSVYTSSDVEQRASNANYLRVGYVAELLRQLHELLTSVKELTTLLNSTILAARAVMNSHANALQLRRYGRFAMNLTTAIEKRKRDETPTLDGEANRAGDTTTLGPTQPSAFSHATHPPFLLFSSS